jgi:hypothetical protein
MQPAPLLLGTHQAQENGTFADEEAAVLVAHVANLQLRPQVRVPGNKDH